MITKQDPINITHRFLKQIRRHANAVYWSLDAGLRERYDHNSGWIFGETSPMKLQRRGKLYTTEEQMGYDMGNLIREFSGNALFNNMSSCKNLVRVFRKNWRKKDIHRKNSMRMPVMVPMRTM